jgi:NitT/TauT family transport system permease protein
MSLSQPSPEGAVVAPPSSRPTSRARQRWRARWRRYDSLLYPLITLGLLILLWEVAVRVLNIKPFLLPPPSAIAARLVDPKTVPVLLGSTVPSVWAMTLSFAICVVVGVTLALLMVASRTFEKSFYPILVAAQAVPKVAIAPLLIVWFGTGLSKNVFVAVLIGLFPVVIDTVIGLRSVPVEMIDLGRSMQASSWQLFRRVRLPYALPYVFAGLKTCITLVVIGVIVGELTGSDAGIGYQLKRAQGMLDTSFLFAAIVILVVVGILSFLLVDLIERMTIPWHVSSRRDVKSVFEE